MFTSSAKYIVLLAACLLSPLCADSIRVQKALIGPERLVDGCLSYPKNYGNDLLNSSCEVAYVEDMDSSDFFLASFNEFLANKIDGSLEINMSMTDENVQLYTRKKKAGKAKKAKKIFSLVRLFKSEEAVKNMSYQELNCGSQERFGKIKIAVEYTCVDQNGVARGAPRTAECYIFGCPIHLSCKKENHSNHRTNTKLKWSPPLKSCALFSQAK